MNYIKKVPILISIALLSNNVYSEDNKKYVSALAYDDAVLFIDKYSKKEFYSRDELIEFFARTKIKKSVIKKSKNQPEQKLTWEIYKKRVVTKTKIESGKSFIANNYETLLKAENDYGVPKEIIASIIGIESFYGKYKGNHNAIDAISTMAFEGGERRRNFFTKELEAFFDNNFENKTNPMIQKSSWAGAFGYPQFISSSIRSYGVDYNNDGRIDLVNSIEDSIGSVANYLNKNGWIKNNYIAEKVSYKGEDLKTSGLSLSYTVSELENYGVLFNRKMRDSKKSKIFTLNYNNQNHHYVGYENFKAITMYNRSNLYAMAVFTLSNEIKGSETI